MKFQIDHDLHIHSFLSPCSRNPEQTPENILRFAKEKGLHTICLTDHFWDQGVPDCPPDYTSLGLSCIETALPLPQEEGTRFLFGCEAEMNWNMEPGIARENYDRFGFSVIATTHFHLDGCLKQAQKETAETRAAAWVDRFDKVLSMDLPFHKVGIAHLTTTLIAPTREEYRQVLDLLPETVIGALFQRAATCGVGIELNADDMKKAFEEGERVWRFYRVAKECGCRFYLGSDAHGPGGLAKSTEIFRRAVDYLELEEDHKLPLVRR